MRFEFYSLCIFVCLFKFCCVKGNEDLVGIRVDTPRAVVKVEEYGLLVVKPDFPVTVRLFGTRLHELAAVYITTNKRQCSRNSYVQPFISSESFEEQSPHTVAFSFSFPYPKHQYYFCFEWRQENQGGNAQGPLHHQGTNRYHHLETRSRVTTRPEARAARQDNH